MGFLDFLKKDKPAVSPMTPLPEPQGMPEPTAPLPPAEPSPQLTPIEPPAAMPVTPPTLEDHAMWQADADLPVPPPPQEKELSADTLLAPPTAPTTASSLSSSSSYASPSVSSSPYGLPSTPSSQSTAQNPAQVSADTKSSDQIIELPDFTDEDLAALDAVLAPSNVSAWAQSDLPSLPVLPKATPAKQTPPPLPPELPPAPVVTIKKTEQVVPAPANAVAIPADELTLPTGEETTVEKLEPSKFLSSQSYFMILGENKALRKALRQNDEVIKEATLRHEQLDIQCKRVASDVNSIQEMLIKVDASLFEE